MIERSSGRADLDLPAFVSPPLLACDVRTTGDAAQVVCAELALVVQASKHQHHCCSHDADNTNAVGPTRHGRAAGNVDRVPARPGTEENHNSDIYAQHARRVRTGRLAPQLSSPLCSQSHWFHTIFLSKSDLEREFNNAEMKKRTGRFTILGMSLSNLLDVHHPPDLIRGLTNTLAEYEQAREDSTTNSRLRQAPRRLFRNRGKRPAELYNDAAGGDSSYLITPHIPFQLDYHFTLIALFDVLSEIYAKISRILGSAPFPRMMGPLGSLSPHPGVADLLDPADDLFSIANASAVPGTTTLGAPAAVDTDAILKIDAKLRKITGTLLKELDHLARNAIKNELASLDPRLDFDAGA